MSNATDINQAVLHINKNGQIKQVNFITLLSAFSDFKKK